MEASLVSIVAQRKEIFFITGGPEREGEEERDWECVCDVCVQMHFGIIIYRGIWCLVISKNKKPWEKAELYNCVTGISLSKCEHSQYSHIGEFFLCLPVPEVL